MIKIQSVVRDIIRADIEARAALLHGYMNLSQYAVRIRPKVESLSKKEATINGIVVALSRLKNELSAEASLMPEVAITNITTKLPLSEIIYENTRASLSELESLHKKLSMSREEFFTSTVSTAELSIVCSSGLAQKVLRHFKEKPKFTAHHLTAVAISFDKKHFDIPNTLFSLFSVVARARINIVEVISTYTELIFIVSEKDFSKTVGLFSELHMPMH